MKDANRIAMFAKNSKEARHIGFIKKYLDENLIKMKNDPKNLDITKERMNLHRQLKQLRKKYNYHDDES